MKRRRKSLVAYMISISAIFIILVTSIDMMAFNRGFFEKEYEKLQVAETIAIPQEDLMNATDALLDYIQEERNEIQIDVTIKGNVREAFNSKEEIHMADVRNLYQFAIKLRLVCAVVLLAGILYLAVKMKQDVISFLAMRFVRTAICFAVIVAFIAVWSFVDFSAVWQYFHMICFRNDLWLLNPATDFMIQMFPEQLFFDLVLRILAVFLVVFLGLTALCLYYLKQEILNTGSTTEIAE